MAVKLLILLLAVAPGLALAEGKVTVATCGASGCSCRLSALTAGEAAAAAGLSPPPSPEANLVSIDGSLRWTTMPLDDVDTVMGGDGKCELALFDEIVPADGMWRDGPVTVNAVSCGAATAMFAQRLATMPRETTPVTWNRVFDGKTYWAAHRAAHPGAEHPPIAFRRVSPRLSTGEVSVSGDGGSMTSEVRLELVDAHRFLAQWSVAGANRDGRCDWSISFPVEWVSR